MVDLRAEGSSGEFPDGSEGGKAPGHVEFKDMLKKLTLQRNVPLK